MLFDLVELSKVHGEKSWAYSSINGKEFKIGVMDWPVRACRACLSLTCLALSLHKRRCCV